MKKLLVVVGPTAVGKSAFALSVAKLLPVEIVSADSRQIYQHLSIGIGKPTVDDRDSVNHHLVDFLEPDGEYSVSHFTQDAKSAISHIHSKGVLPIVVGGTGQYVWALVEGWNVPAVPPNLALRSNLEDRAAEIGSLELHKELASKDQKAALKIDPRNTRRIVRALELIYSGSKNRRSVLRSPPLYNLKIIGLTLDREKLYERIDYRIDSMIKMGWLEEVEQLWSQGYDHTLPSMSSIGYSELSKVHRGEYSLSEAVQLIKNRTHRFARNQHTWFRQSDERINWFDADKGIEEAMTRVTEWAKELP